MFLRREQFSPLQTETVITPISKKRKPKAKTPIVDDEVRRCSKFKKGARQEHVQLDNEPQRKKGADRKTVSISTVAKLKVPLLAGATWMKLLLMPYQKLF